MIIISMNIDASQTIQPLNDHIYIHIEMLDHPNNGYSFLLDHVAIEPLINDHEYMHIEMLHRPTEYDRSGVCSRFSAVI
jgi:hypothetical protein